MKFHIENGKIVGAINLLSKLSLKGKQSRHRSKMIKDLNTQLQEVAEQEKVLLKDHCRLDEKGEPKKTEDGRHWDVKDIDAFAADRKELYEEEFILEGGNAWGYLTTVKEILLECELEWSGEEADLYDYLCDEFEKEEDVEKGA
jgi:hypothetical protein